MEHLNVRDFYYDLPQEKIALYPLKERDQSKLLVYDRGQIQHAVFHQLADYLPKESYLVFNNTRVIPARIRFAKSTGAVIEIFLLHPVHPTTLVADAMQATRRCDWQCTIGNIKRWPVNWKLGQEKNGVRLTAALADRDRGIVSFTWTGDRTFAEVISSLGETPLPPYIKRQAESADRHTYQTIYSRLEGAVAAPTAGLHFTDQVFRSLASRGIDHDFVTLHVSAGTFQPIKAENANAHVMHEEQIVVTRANIANLIAHIESVIPVGTTSLRTLETLYWYGARLMNGNSEFRIGQDEPFRQIHTPPVRDSLTAIAKYMDEKEQETLVGETSIYIRPGYKFRICRGLITNFHQPASTLILLVAALLGPEWRKVYDEALRENYRFLSYGDSSLLLPVDR
ncbi:MAG TPA: S-adenosylmethionine:tRNA ribosyltransferase-isomerase [Chryseosolibacter sp.]|nr:S-adenosylmethionine:tRNA ribosyltransferase-isomerase [Chryseosolibacter sp.]